MDEPLHYFVDGFFMQREKLIADGRFDHPRFRYAHQFQQAQKIIIAAPFWDLSFPALLKVYIENLCVEGITFGCDETGTFGTCQADRMLFLTTRGDELDKIYGLQLGAWDYQTKPVSLEFLVTRVESLFKIKETSSSYTTDLRALGDIELNPVKMCVSWKSIPVELTPTEFDILSALLENPEGASIEELVRATRQGLVEDNTINTHILHIRKKLKNVDPGFNCIKTRYGFGYCWICQ